MTNRTVWTCDALKWSALNKFPSRREDVHVYEPARIRKADKFVIFASEGCFETKPCDNTIWCIIFETFSRMAGDWTCCRREGTRLAMFWNIYSHDSVRIFGNERGKLRGFIAFIYRQHPLVLNKRAACAQKRTLSRWHEPEIELKSIENVWRPKERKETARWTFIESGFVKYTKECSRSE